VDQHIAKKLGRALCVLCRCVRLGGQFAEFVRLDAATPPLRFLSGHCGWGGCRMGGRRRGRLASITRRVAEAERSKQGDVFADR